MKSITLGYCFLLLCNWFLPVCAAEENLNTVTDEERKQGFVSLFNGRDLQGWRHQGNWKVEDGAIVCVKSVDHSENAKPKTADDGSLYRTSWEIMSTMTVPQDFELRFEWKATKKSERDYFDENGSWHLEYYATRWLFATKKSPEDKTWGRVAFLYRTDDCLIGLLGDDIAGPNVSVTTCPLSGLTAALPEKITTRSPEAKSLPLGQWNRSRIVWKGEMCQHWLNDARTSSRDVMRAVSHDSQNKQQKEVLTCFIECSKHRDRLHVVLQADGGVPSERFCPIHYRAIKLRALPDSVASPKQQH